MTDREKVVKAFVLCRVNERCSKNCPYWDNDASIKGCTKKLATDVYSLLKDQEPVAPDVDSEKTYSCGNCGTTVGYYPAGCKTPEKLCRFCPECGRAVKWND